MKAVPTGARSTVPVAEADLPMQIWGVDNRGQRFLQDVRARDLSLEGAMLSGLDTELRSGDVIGILFAGRKARYRVIWIRDAGTARKIQAAVQRIAPDDCPWQDLLSPALEAGN